MFYIEQGNKHFITIQDLKKYIKHNGLENMFKYNIRKGVPDYESFISDLVIITKLSRKEIIEKYKNFLPETYQKEIEKSLISEEIDSTF